ncbi:MAG: hypothetical protein KF712_00280 [Akkermansiaceae bacterium]|nr:hypothetical protein [Akkermansiaceae bacterium]
MKRSELMLIVIGLPWVGVLLPLLSESAKFSWIDVVSIVILLVLIVIYFGFIRKKRHTPGSPAGVSSGPSSGRKGNGMRPEMLGGPQRFNAGYQNGHIPRDKTEAGRWE